MTRKKKSGFLTFCFSLLPGVGEMYLGFMKMGISLMGIFWALIAVSSVLNIGPLMFIVPIIWFYGFFHVHNLAGLTDEEFMGVEDVYLFNFDNILDINKENVKKNRKAIAVILIIVGIVMIWNGLMDIGYSYLPERIVWILRQIGYSIPQMVIGIAIVIGGFLMIKGKKKELEANNNYGAETDNKDA